MTDTPEDVRIRRTRATFAIAALAALVAALAIVPFGASRQWNRRRRDLARPQGISHGTVFGRKVPILAFQYLGVSHNTAAIT